MEIPASLRAWFVAHFVVDVLIAIPLVLVPEEILPRLGWASVDPVSSRLVGAALMAIGVQSWRGRRAGVESYRAMLGLKIVWSLTAIVGLIIAIGRGAAPLAFLLLAIFIGFCGVWSHYAIRFRQHANAEAAGPRSQDNDDDDDDTASPADDPNDPQ